MARKVARTRNGGTWTEAQYWARVRGALRRAFAAWKPAQYAMTASRRPSQSENKRQKWEYQCARCLEWCKGSDVRRDHIEPCGSLRNLDDLAGWLDRLTPESSDAFQVLCEECHQLKTNEERKRGQSESD